jgi:hypothetical protein
LERRASAVGCIPDVCGDYSVMTTEAIRIDGTEISCGVNYYHGLSLESFEDCINGKMPKKPKYVAWGEVGYQDYLVATDAYYEAVYNTFRKGYTYIFSDNNKGEGQDIAKFIRKNKLGKIVSSGWTRNPNSGNKICTWVWIYNGKKVKKDAKRKTAAKRVGRRYATR